MLCKLKLWQESYILKMINLLKNSLPWLKDIVLVIFVITTWYLNTAYVTTAKFDQFSKQNAAEHIVMTSTMVSMDKTLALMQQNTTAIAEQKAAMSLLSAQVIADEKTLVEHEQRLRFIEASKKN
jgi:hypothetical protein